MPPAPTGQDFSFLFAASRGSGNLLNINDPQHLQLAGGNCGAIVIGETAANELQIGARGRIMEDRDLSGNATMHEVGGLQRAGATGVNRHNDDVDRGRGCLMIHERPPGAPQGPVSAAWQGRHKSGE